MYLSVDQGRGRLQNRIILHIFVKYQWDFWKTLFLSPSSAHKRALKRGSFGNCLDEVSRREGRHYENIIFLFCLKKLIRRMNKRQRWSNLIALGRTLKLRCPGGGARPGSFPHLELVAWRKHSPSWTASDTLLRTKLHRLGTHGSGYLGNCFLRTAIFLLHMSPISEALQTLPRHDFCPGGKSTWKA